MTLREFLVVDLAPLLTGTLCALACGLLGNFLVLRRQSLVGDAVSHAVLPGLVGGFLVFGTRDSGPMFLGALVAAMATGVMIELVRRYARVEPGAAMGVVFSAMFALGVVLVSTDAARDVDLDADCVLNGQLEDVSWLDDPGRGAVAPSSWASLADPGVLRGAPRELKTVALAALVVAASVALFYKELKLTSFDPDLATSLGFRAGLVNQGLMALVAATAVAAFEAVGSILVVAMLICPAATARLLTDRLGVQIALSAVVALATGIGGYVLGAFAPGWFGVPHSLSVSGTMTLVAGALLGLTVFLSPGHGLLAKRLRLLALRVGVARDDLLAMLYRVEESAGVTLAPRQARAALGGGLAPRIALAAGARRGLLTRADEVLSLTPAGREAARSLVRSHRLWETYLVHELGLRPDHVHRTAGALEHLTSDAMQRRLGREEVATDPHGKPIP